MIRLRGAPALSTFRTEKLLQKLKKINAGIRDVYAEYVHFVYLESPLTDKEETQLQALLSYGPKIEPKSSLGILQLVVPRFGTISPWSSKATDIAHNTGLNKVRRIERGIAYYLDGIDKLSRELSSALYDRMVETILDKFDLAEKLFEQHEPRPLTRI